jgi:predicted RNA-binding protein with PIN domain
MPYLIDGHNLVPKLGLKLSDPEDESKLIERVLEFYRLEQTRADIYFDGAGPGQAERRSFGRVTAFFVRKNSSADEAIEGRLSKLGRDARNWRVVSSDQRVQASAREVHAQVIPSDVFARLVEQAGARNAEKEEPAPELNQKEVEDWLNLFKNRKKDL